MQHETAVHRCTHAHAGSRKKIDVGCFFLFFFFNFFLEGAACRWAETPGQTCTGTRNTASHQIPSVPRATVQSFRRFGLIERLTSRLGWIHFFQRWHTILACSAMVTRQYHSNCNKDVQNHSILYLKGIKKNYRGAIQLPRTARCIGC